MAGSFSIGKHKRIKVIMYNKNKFYSLVVDLLGFGGGGSFSSLWSGLAK
jgi:hypothetical protein